VDRRAKHATRRPRSRRRALRVALQAASLLLRRLVEPGHHLERPPRGAGGAPGPLLVEVLVWNNIVVLDHLALSRLVCKTKDKQRG